MIKNQIKFLLGNLLIALQPKKATELLKNGMTISLKNNLTIKQRLMRYALLKRAEENRDFNSLAEFHNNYWSKRGKDYFESTDDILETFFIPYCTPIFTHLEKVLKQQPENFKTIVEIGTGSGDVLNYLSSKFPKIDHFIGIDLSVAQIEINKNKFSENSGLQFVASDGIDWIKSHGSSNTIFITSRGVLEYFTQQRLQELLEELKNLGKTIFIAIEPIAADHDFSVNTNSMVFGFERSFSHNYIKLFESAGFNIWHNDKIIHAESGYHFSIIGALN